MSDPGGADGPREPSEAECSVVTAGVKGGRNADTGAKVMDQGGKERSEAEGLWERKRWLPADQGVNMPLRGG